MKNHRNKYGWAYCGVVEFRREWCVICAKAISHEYLNGTGVCLGCKNIVEPEIPISEPLQLISMEETVYSGNSTVNYTPNCTVDVR